MANKKNDIERTNAVPADDPFEEFRSYFSSLESHVHHVRHELEDLQTLSTKLLDVGVAISSEIDLFSLLSRIIDEAKNLLKAQKGTLYLVDHEANELFFHVVDSEQLKEIRLPINDKSIAGYVALTGKTLNIDDVYKIPKKKPYSFNKGIDLKTGFHTRSMLTVPMVNHEGTITGAVQLINKVLDWEIRQFTVRDERILLSLASQATVAIENAQLYKDLADLFKSLVRFSANAIDARDPATAGHSRRVATYAVATARAMKCFSDDEIQELEYAAWLHDVGKIGVREHILTKANKLFPEELEKVRERFESIKISFNAAMLKKQLAIVGKTNEKERLEKIADCFALRIRKADDDLKFIERINKPGYMSPEDLSELDRVSRKTYLDSSGRRRRFLMVGELRELRVARGNLTDAERKIMSAHVDSSFKILNGISFSRRLMKVPEIAGMHHERLDGSGYPRGLKGDEISLRGRIMGLVDVYDALTAQDRPYKPAIPVKRSLAILREEVKAGKLDKKVFNVFIKKRIYNLKDTGQDGI